jgi:hypothetical protein
MKLKKSLIMMSAIAAFSMSASAATYKVNAEGLFAGSSSTEVANPSFPISKVETVSGFSIGGNYIIGDKDASIKFKDVTPSERKLFEIRADVAQTLNYASYGSLRVAPLGVSYTQLHLSDIGTKEYNIYYSPSLEWKKELNALTFVEAEGLYNLGVKSHYKNSVSGISESLPKSTGYETALKVGFNIQKDTTMTIGYHYDKYDYAGDSLHLDTKDYMHYLSLGFNKSF